MKKMIDRNESGASPRRRFEETYKRHAVDLTLQGDRTVKTVAKELGLPAWQLYEWRKLFAPRPGEAGPAPQTLEEAEKEIGRLRGEVVRLREREVVLKKSLGILSETPGSGMSGSRR
jgi:transposase-like protein